MTAENSLRQENVNLGLGNQIQKNIVIFSTVKLYRGNSAASSRVLRYAKALAMNNRVYLFTFLYNRNINSKNIYEVEKNIFICRNDSNHKNKVVKKITYPFEIMRFVKNISSYTEKLGGETVFLLYPSTKILLDLTSILYLTRLKKKKVYLEINEVRKYSNHLEDQSPYHFFRRNSLLLKYKISENFSKYFKGLICISTHIREYFSKYNKNIILIPILSDNLLLKESRHKLYNEGDTFLICYSGQIILSKENLESLLIVLLRLSKTFNKFELHLYGPAEDTELQKLGELIKKHNLEKHIFYKGFVEQSVLLNIFKKYHLLVSPRSNNRQNQHGFSTKLAEYLESGTPVLLTDVSDNCLYIKDGYNGFVVEPDNIKAMVEKLKDIIGNYNTISSSIVSNAYDTVDKYFSYKNYSEVLNEFLI